MCLPRGKKHLSYAYTRQVRGARGECVHIQDVFSWCSLFVVQACGSLLDWVISMNIVMEPARAAYSYIIYSF